MRNVPTVRLILLGATLAMGAQGAKTLDIYFIDVEGGQSTLVVSPSGQSLLIDTGYAGNGGRDAIRIAAAAKAAGVKKIDTLLITHFHPDHGTGRKDRDQGFGCHDTNRRRPPPRAERRSQSILRGSGAGRRRNRRES